MSNFSKRQKIVIGIIGGIVACVICYYVYAKDEGFVEYGGEENVTENLGESSNVINEIDEGFSDSMIVVHVSGAVNKEGVVELKAKSRISDAIDKAGGVREDADLEKINLAFVLEDGMKVYIPSVNDKEKIKENISTEKDASQIKDSTSTYVTSESGTSSIDIQASSSSSSKTSKVNINTASQTELETLPGIGPSIALKIISYRNEKGKFSSIEDIKNVSGIGDVKFANVKELISV